MFIILLKFSSNKGDAAKFMQQHRDWLQQGFEQGVFLLAGSLNKGQGGGILATGVDKQALEQKIQQDPFVSEQVVSAEIYELEPSKFDTRLSFLAD